MSNLSPQKGNRIRLKGLFADGIWKCNCEPRLPAGHFQTKNGGKNQGRWFYTCQKTPPQTCGFFLWDDDAKAREAAAVLSNSRTEPSTPKRPTSSSVFDTSRKEMRDRYTSSGQVASTTPPQANKYADGFDWSESDADDDADPSASRKSRKTGPQSSPGNRTRGYADVSPTPLKQLDRSAYQGSMKPPESSQLSRFETPRSATVQDTLLDTPSKLRGGNYPAVVSYPYLTPSASVTSGASPFKTSFSLSGTPASGPSPLETDIFAVLTDANINLAPQAVESLRMVCHRHSQKAKGLEKGRDSVRITLREKEADIAKSNERITALLAELDVNRRLIARLGGDTSSTVDTETTQASTGLEDTDSAEESS